MKSLKFTAAVVTMLFAATLAYAYDDSGYASKTIHESGDATYKHPQQKSYTGPFDYAPVGRVAAPRRVEAGNKCNSFTFDATKSSDPDNQKISYLWEFGDGQTSDQPIVTHAYDKAGNYTVTLTIKDNSGQVCDTDVTTLKVSPNFPPTAVAGPEAMGCVGENLTFDASASTANGTPTYTWDFGDGQTATGAKVTHVYDKAGNYPVRLVIDDGKGTACSVATASTSAKIGSRPSVSLQGPESICVGRTAAFDAQGVGASKYHWDFGDASTWDGGSKATHNYAKAGDYTVTVTADNGQGFSCSVAVDSKKIKVFASPVADAGENLVCCVGKTSTFDGSKSYSPSGAALDYSWDFGDGGTANTAQATHVYEKPGNYRVILTVKDNSGSECGVASDSFVATVNAKPLAVAEVR